MGTLEISGGIYNTAGFLQGDSWRKDTNIITSKTQALGSATPISERVWLRQNIILNALGRAIIENSSRDFFVASFPLQQLR